VTKVQINFARKIQNCEKINL